MSLTLLAANAVSVSYGSCVVVHDATIALAPGAVTVLIGPNGSGKSTLLRAVSRLQPMRTGSVEIGGDDLRALSGRELARRLTMLTQGRRAPGGLTVGEVVAFGRHPHRRRWGGDAEGPRAIARALELTGLADLVERDTDTLSGGQAQRVWLAACLAQDTQILLLDEPTTYLDLRYQVELLDLVVDLAHRHGITVGVVLHDLNQAAAIADHIVLLEQGRVAAAGPAVDVLTAELLTSVYQIPIRVLSDPSGALSVAPQRRR